MSRLVSLLIVLLAIAVATPVLAEDRLSLSGQMRVRGFHLENQFNFNDDVYGSSNYFNQRLRLAGKISVAEGVSVNFRSDMSNKTWGTGNNNVQLQQAFMNIDKQMFNLRAGRMNYAIGNAIAIDTQGEGAVFTIKGAIPVEIGYFKIVETLSTANGRTGNERFSKDDDIDLYTVAVKHGTDMYNAVVFGGYYRDASAPVNGDNLEAYMVGVQANFNLNPIKMNFELNYFDGEQDTTDYKGLQAYVDANMAISETITAGVAFLYAEGQTGGDVQVTDFSDDGSFMPETYSFMQLQFNMFPGQSLNNTFDPTGNGTGVIAGQLYGQFKVMDDLTLRASAGYWEMEEDDVTYESFITATGSARYALAARTNLDTVVAYTIPETRGNAPDDAALLLGFNLNVNF